MKKIIAIFGVIFLFSLKLTFAEEFNFRKTKWGMNKDEVKKSEQVEIFGKEDEQELMYKDKLSDFDVTIVYTFLSNKLEKAKYIINTEHTNKNDYIDDFSILNKLFESKYGKPVEDNQFWSNDLYKNMPQDWGTAISLGHLSFYKKYETEETAITLILNGENNKIQQKIVFITNPLQPPKIFVTEPDPYRNNLVEASSPWIFKDSKASSNKYQIRVFIQNKKIIGKQLYLIFDLHDWAFFNEARDISGKKLDLIEIDREVKTYGSWMVNEQVAINLTDEYIEEGKKNGFNIKVYGKRWEEEVVIPNIVIQGFMDKLNSIAN